MAGRLVGVDEPQQIVRLEPPAAVIQLADGTRLGRRELSRGPAHGARTAGEQLHQRVPLDVGARRRLLLGVSGHAELL
eukprot:5054910-Prymnesium_polylepis.1